MPQQPAYVLADFNEIAAVDCPCGKARRAFANVDQFPGTLHVTEVSESAQKHYHKMITETYFFLECESDAQMELNDEVIDVKPGVSIVITPGTRHRALGRMKVLIVAVPNFDPNDEWFD